MIKLLPTSVVVCLKEALGSSDAKHDIPVFTGQACPSRTCRGFAKLDPTTFGHHFALSPAFLLSHFSQTCSYVAATARCLAVQSKSE